MIVGGGNQHNFENTSDDNPGDEKDSCRKDNVRPEGLSSPALRSTVRSWLTNKINSASPTPTT